jgi:hypothetical protein
MQNTLTFKIHYNSGDYSDEFIISGESIEEIRHIAFEECERRGWNINQCWSEKI